MKLEQKINAIHAALWCFDFEHMPPLEDDRQKTYLYAFSTLLKKNMTKMKSANIIERFRARKNLIALTNLWDSTIETGKTINGRSSEVVVINKITLPAFDIYTTFIETAKLERAKSLEEELSKKIDDKELDSKIKEMKYVFHQKGFDRLVPTRYDENSTYLYAFYLLLNKNEKALLSPEKIERLQAKKNISILVSLWKKNVDTYNMVHPHHMSTMVVVEHVQLPEKEEYDKFVKTALDWKSKDDQRKIDEAKAKREGKQTTIPYKTQK